MSSYAMAVDIGGTFTDVVLRDAYGPHLGRQDPDHARKAWNRFLPRDRRCPEDRRHPAGRTSPTSWCTPRPSSPTRSSSARARRTALLVTEGFRDILTIRDEHRYEMFDPQIEFPEPLVAARADVRRDRARARRPARCSSRLDAQADRGDRRRSEARRASSRSRFRCSTPISIRRTNARCATSSVQHAPELYVSISSDVAPQIREYPRTSTVAMNAYTAPITGPISTRCATGSSSAASRNDPLIMLSNGGVIGIDVAGALSGADGGVRPGGRRARRGLLRRAARPRPAAVLRHGRHDREGLHHRGPHSRWWSATSRSTASIASSRAAACRS